MLNNTKWTNSLNIHTNKQLVQILVFCESILRLWIVAVPPIGLDCDAEDWQGKRLLLCT